jgi:hypothetical protein
MDGLFQAVRAPRGAASDLLLALALLVAGALPPLSVGWVALARLQQGAASQQLDACARCLSLQP